MGICLEQGEPKIYGAALLSSISESEKAMRLKGQFNPVDCRVIENTPYEAFDQQSVYFMSKSLKDAYETILEYTAQMKRPFKVEFDEEKEQIVFDRKVKRLR